MNFDDGLSDNNLSAILQDQKGFIWFGTKDGLNRYDGYNFQVFKNDPNDKYSISNNTVECIYEDKNGDLWIGTFGGLNKLEKETGHFLNHNNHEPFKFNKLQEDIYDITEDNKGNIWVGTAWKGVVVLNKSGVAYEFTNEDEGVHKLSSNSVTSIVQDLDNKIWIGTTNGLNVVAADLRSTNVIDLGMGMNINSINDLLVDKSGNLWIATKSGLIYRDKKTEELKYFFFDQNNPFNYDEQRNVLHLAENSSFVFLGTGRNGLIAINKNTKKVYQYKSEGSSNLSDNHVRTIHVDNAQSLWVGTNGHGINYSNSKTNMFTSYVNTGRNKNGLGEGTITAFYRDSKNRFWVAVDGSGLYLFDEKTRKFKKINADKTTNGITSNNIRSISEDYSGRLWLATFGSKVIIYNPSNEKFEKLPPAYKILSDELSTIYKDSQNRIWIGSENAGVFVINQSDGSISNYSNSPNDNSSLSYNHVTFVYEDAQNTIWIGTNLGLNKFIDSTQSFQRFLPDTSDANSISNVAATCMIQDKKGIYWIGTAGGLNSYNSKTEKFENFSTEDGLSSKVIYAILEDDLGNLWISTDNGITFFGNENNHRVVRTFTQRDGLQGKEFSQGAAYKNNSGVLYFGGSKGFTEIVPGSIKKNTTPPPVHLTNLKLFYELVKPGPNSVLKKPISEIDKLELDYSQNVLTFEFTALNFIVSSENEYKYKLEGFDKKWINVENIRSATYTNLNPGKYTFKVLASNNDGVWNEEGASIQIIITPPYWMTWWFKLIIALLAATIVVFIFRVRIRTIRKRNKILEQRVLERTEQIETQKEEIEAQRDEILSNQIQMKESIEVGKIIQDAILPPVELIRDRFPNSFVYYQAKDIVSGDFYWFYRKGKRSYIAAADCTGHGVAGGFLTMIGQNHLHDIAESDENLTAADILDQLNQRVIKSLRQRPEHMDTRDGMDITLCIFEDDSNTIQYAGAKNPIYLIRKGADAIEKHDVDIFSIGIPIRGAVRKFENKELKLSEGDMIYMFSDGYADQFNEDYVEKFKHLRFRKTLMEIHNEDVDTQRGILEKTIMVWKGEEEQTDDMLVMGIRI